MDWLQLALVAVLAIVVIAFFAAARSGRLRQIGMNLGFFKVNVQAEPDRKVQPLANGVVIRGLDMTRSSVDAAAGTPALVEEIKQVDSHVRTGHAPTSATTLVPPPASEPTPSDKTPSSGPTAG